MIVNLWQEKEYPPKVIAMNEAVIELLEQGRDVNSLRVSEITQKAGIGKGTAYEYFSSKEEIIATALEYDLAKQVAHLVKIEEHATGFRDMLEKLMIWMTDSFKQNSGFTILFKADMNTPEMGQELKKRCPGIEIIYKMIEQALVLGEQEGVIEQMDHYYGSVAIISQVMAYSMYLVNPNAVSVSEKDVQQFAVNSIIKMLN